MISINLTKAKDIAHEKRRAARTTEFAPLDIKATIPSEAAAAEAARQAIREKYATLQAQMDAAQTADELKALLPEA
jgi:predicted  nucleic acid-binding Zn-ribbon protein